MIPLRLQTILLIAMCAAFACCTLLGGIALVDSLGDHRNLRLGAHELSRFHAALDAATAVSAERGPANSAMGPSAGNQTALLEALDVKRAETDAKVGILRERFRDDIARSARVSGLLTALSLRLAEGRAAVDGVVAMPVGQRSSDNVIDAIEAMFLAADAATALRDSLAQTIVTLTPQISTEIILGTSVGSLRESAGRLGSYVVMMLSSGPERDARILPSLHSSAGQLGQLRDVIRNYAAAVLPDPAIRRAIDDVEVHYFGSAMPFALRTADIEAIDNSMSAAAFTRDYVPGMKYAENLRQLIIAASTEKLASLQAAALAKVLTSAALLCVICIILIVLAVVFKRSLFNPLIVARQQILAIADDDLSEPAEKAGTSPEVQEMFAGLSVLRQQQRQKRALECEQARLSAQLKALSERDYLTGLMNRRAVETSAARMIAQADEAGGEIAVLLIDVDHFKAINDSHGHGAGDLVLQKVAAAFEAQMRPGDVVSRFGGEEFLVLLDKAGETQAVQIAERLRRHLAGLVLDADLALQVTASFGVAVRPPGAGIGWQQMVQTADRRLYAAKHAGRNRVCAQDDAPPAERRPRLV